MPSKSVNVYLLDGDENGCMRCNISYFNGFLFKIPRTQLEKWKDREEMNYSGVYFLFGNSDVDDKPVVYIGQAGSRKNGKGVLNRLQEHNKNPDKNYWNEAVFFSTKDDSLGATEISYIESTFISMAVEADRYTVENDNQPSLGNVTEEKRSEMDEFIDYAKTMMRVIGYRVFTPLAKRKTDSSVSVDDGDIEVFLERKVQGNIRTRGHAVWTSEGFVLLKGSVVSPGVSKAAGKGVLRKREDTKIEKTIDGFVLREDVVFSSPSSAAAFVIGNAANGWTEWKSADGVPLKNLLDRSSIPSKGKSKSHDSSTPYDGGEIAGETGESVKFELRLTRTIKSLNMTVKGEGVYDAKTKKLTVLAGSIVSPFVSETVKSKIDKERANAKIENNILQEDIAFSSPSKAAEFVVGNSMNGWTEWKDQNGVTLDKLARNK